jgi:prepilin-type processing-associated H-X9-DG protein
VPDVKLKKLDEYANIASSLVLVLDGIGGMINARGLADSDNYRVNARHGRATTTNVLFLDGHVESLLASKISDVWAIEGDTPPLGYSPAVRFRGE